MIINEENGIAHSYSVSTDDIIGSEDAEVNIQIAD